MSVNFEAMKAAARVAAQHHIVGSKGNPNDRIAIEQPVRDFLDCLQRVKDNRELVIASAAGMQIRDNDPMDRVRAVREMMTHLSDALGVTTIREEDVFLSAYVQFYRESLPE